MQHPLGLVTRSLDPDSYANASHSQKISVSSESPEELMMREDWLSESQNRSWFPGRMGHSRMKAKQK